MDTIEKMFNDFIDGAYPVIVIPKPVFAEMRKLYYAGFIRACMMFEKELPECSEEMRGVELECLKLECQTYFKTLRGEI